MGRETGEYTKKQQPFLECFISPKTKDLKQVVGAGKLVTQVLDPLSKTLGPDLFWNSEIFQILESLHGHIS